MGQRAWPYPQALSPPPDIEARSVAISAWKVYPWRSPQFSSRRKTRMLDAFKKTGATKVQSDELQQLIAASKEERAALSTMLTQVQLHSAKLASAAKSLQDVEDKAGQANARLDEVNERLAKAGKRATELEAIDARIRSLVDAVTAAEAETSRLTAPDGELQKHKQALQSLSS